MSRAPRVGPVTPTTPPARPTALAKTTAEADLLIQRWVSEDPAGFDKRVISRLEETDGGCLVGPFKRSTGGDQIDLPRWLTPERRRCVMVRRAVYIATIGPVPWGQQVDCVGPAGCRNTRCANPDHMIPATIRQTNNDYGLTTLAAVNTRKDACIAGHPLVPENLRADSALLGWRGCLECDRRRGREQRDSFRAAAAVLGISQAEYTRTHGQSTRRALDVVGAVDGAS